MTTLARMPVDQLAGLPSANRLESCAFEFGTGYDSYLALDPGRECFWSRDRRGVAASVRTRPVVAHRRRAAGSRRRETGRSSGSFLCTP